MQKVEPESEIETHWFEGYSPPSGGYDEVFDDDRTLRPHWRQFLQDARLSSSAVPTLAEQTRRLLRENGVSYNLHGAPEGPGRPWELDLFPLLIPAEEWKQLSAGLKQRVELLELILRDLYGAQRLIREGDIPAELVYGQPGFLIPCQGLVSNDSPNLSLYAAQLARDVDGNWIVLADRTQGPAGAGYALENRLVASRVLPDAFQRLRVERLAPFFMGFKRSLESRTRTHHENPRVVLLSPGQRSPTAFEDAYLSRYLGFVLVEGEDLTVRGASVYLKTLGGLLPVDVIVRRLGDNDCDPLELNPTSFLGVSGLVQSIRSRNTLVANSLGSSVLESPSLLAYLDSICRKHFGEELKIASAKVWWLGDASARAEAISEFDNLLIKPARPHRGEAAIMVDELSSRAKQELMTAIKARPFDYVAKRRVPRSTAPVWDGLQWRPWHVVLRAFAGITPKGCEVMPGGLARVSPKSSELGDSISSGLGSKDVWVLSDAPVEPVSMLPAPAPPLELRRGANDVPSRVVDHLFWLGRYLERAESLVRHLRTCVVRMTTDSEPTRRGVLAELFLAMRETSSVVAPESLPTPPEPMSFERLMHDVHAAIWGKGEVPTLAQTLDFIRRTATVVRDRLSIDAWRIVTHCELPPWPSSNPLGFASLNESLGQLNRILTLLTALAGLAMESMTRGVGWRFLDAGRRIERGLTIARLLGNTVAVPHRDSLFTIEAVLEIADSSMTYRNRYLTSLQLPPLLDLLLIDEANPRSLCYQIWTLAEHVRKLPDPASAADRTALKERVLGIQGMIRLADVESMCEPDSQGARPHLEIFLNHSTRHIEWIADLLSHAYLTHTARARRLGYAEE